MQCKNYHMTFVRPVTKAFIPVPLPSQNVLLWKFFGTSTPSCNSNPGTPATWSMPTTAIRSSTSSLNIPKAFCKRNPHVRNTPCIRRANVMHINATNRVMPVVGSMDAACSMSVGYFRETHIFWMNSKHTFTENDTICRDPSLEKKVAASWLR